MDATVVTVQGGYDGFFPAERCTVSVAVGFEGAEREPVVARTSRGTAALVAGVELRRDAGSVTWSATDRLQVWAHRPYSETGEQRPLVHHAQTMTRVRFADIDALAQWVEAAARYDGVRIEGLEWTLTAATRSAAVAEVRTAAVRDAQEKAAAYADALGLVGLRCVALADAGMLGDHTRPASSAGPAAFARVASTSTPEPSGLSFTPADIAVSAVVDARFVGTQVG